MSRPSGPSLLLDEMFSPGIAEQLRRSGYDVVALVADPELRALSDPAVYEWATVHDRRVATENVTDFRPLVAEGAGPGVLFTSSRTFARSRRNPRPLVNALVAWLTDPAPRPIEDWLQQAPEPDPV